MILILGLMFSRLPGKLFKHTELESLNTFGTSSIDYSVLHRDQKN